MPLSDKGNSIETPVKYYDLTELKSIMKGDDEFLLLMLNTFLKNAKENIVALDELLAGKEYRMIGEIAHKMLNSYRQLVISHTLQDLEKLELLLEAENVVYDNVARSIAKVKEISYIVFEKIDGEITKINF